MPRPRGKLTDTEPLELWEYTLIMAQLFGHWHIFYQLLWAIGIRCGEALALRKQDLDNGYVWVTREKRIDHPREQLPLNSELFVALEYLTKKLKPNQRIFPYTSQAAALTLKLAAKRAEIRVIDECSTVHPHLFRHGFGNRAYEITKDLVLVQRMIGHKDMRSTQRYAKPTKTKIIQTFRDINKPGPSIEVPPVTTNQSIVF